MPIGFRKYQGVVAFGKLMRRGLVAFMLLGLIGENLCYGDFPGFAPDISPPEPPNPPAADCKDGARLNLLYISDKDGLLADILVTAIYNGPVSGTTIRQGAWPVTEEEWTTPGGKLKLIKKICKELGSSPAQAKQISKPAQNGTVAAPASGPIDTVAGDFNGDGHSDVAITNELSDNVSIYLRQADGNFGGPALFATGVRPQSIRVGDFNKDGKTDLVAANAGQDSGDVSLLLGDGNGGFAAPHSIASGQMPWDVAVADFNKDGNLDLAVADSGNTAQILLHLGKGDGGFQAMTALPVPEWAQSLAVVDLNADQNPDIVSNGAVLLGNGDGTFKSAVGFPLGAAPYVVRVGDLNADAKPDIVVASGGSHVVSVLLGQGDGGLQAPRYYITGHTPAEVAIVDLDDDNKLDLLVSNGKDDHLTLLYGNGDGSFSGLQAYPTVDNPTSPLGAVDAAAADFTGDGIADVLVANDDQKSALLTGLGDGRLGAIKRFPGLDGSQVIAGDWNGDGKQDAAFLHAGASAGGVPNVSIALGQGNANFANPAQIILPGGDYSEVGALIAAKLNGDDFLDLITTNTGTDSVSVLLGDGAGNFTAQPELPVGDGPLGVAVGDLNGDGKPDLAIANRGGGEGLTGSLQIALGNGDGSFQPPQTLRTGVRAIAAAIADINLDGKADLAAIIETKPYHGDVEIFPGNGDGTFAAAQALGFDYGFIQGLQVADADQDGKPDLAFALKSIRVAGLKGRGNGAFDSPGFMDIGGQRGIVAHLDADALADIVAPGGLGFVSACLFGDCPGYVPGDSGQNGNTNGSGLDPFLCWQASPAKASRNGPAYPPFVPVQQFDVADPIGSSSVGDPRQFDLLKPLSLCNPVVINNTAPDVLSHAGHLEGYQSKRSKTQPAQAKFVAKQVAIANRFGRLTLNLTAPADFLTPTATALGAGGADMLAAGSLEHFQCYQAKVAKAKRGQPALPAFTAGEVVLQDNLAGPLRFRLASPDRFCAPASVDAGSADAYDAAQRLTCYPLKLAKIKPAQAKPESQILSTQNRFGDEVLRAKSTKALCVSTQLE